MRELPDIHVARPRLVDVLEPAQIALIEAPGGFGKTVLAAELAARLDVPSLGIAPPAPLEAPSLLAAALRQGAARAGLSDLVAALAAATSDDEEACAAALLEAFAGSRDGLFVVVDEAQELTGGAAGTLARVASGLPDGCRLAILGRALPPALAALDGPGVVRLASEALTFERREVGVLLETAVADTGAAEESAVFGAARGWPALTALAAARLAREPRRGRARLAIARRSLAGLVDDALAALEPDAQAAAGQLAHLPLLSPELVDAVAGEGAFERLVREGLPLAPRRDGWFELPGRVRDELAGRAPLQGAVARRAAAVYTELGELATALQLLAAAGEHAAAAESIAAAPLDELDEVGPPVLLAVLALAPDDDLRPHAHALVQTARVADLARAPAVADVVLARAERLVPAGEETRELLAETAMRAFRRRDYAAAAARADEVLAAAGPGEVVARGRALQVRALADSEHASTHAAMQLQEAAALFALAGETRWRGEALAALAYHFHYHLGRLEAAQAAMADALALLPVASRVRATWLTFQAEIATYAGDLPTAEAALGEAESYGRAIGDHRTLAYVAWVGTAVAAIRGDAPLAAERFALAERFGGYDAGTGLLLIADAAAVLARLGDATAAGAFLERAEAGAGDLDAAIVADWPRGIYEARFGDPGRAEEVLAAYHASPLAQMPPRDEWRVQLERAGAAARRGDDRAAAALAARAFEAARALGLDALVPLHEPALVERLRDGAPSSAPVVTVETLGGFAVSADGRALDLAPGHPTTLVKMLAVARAPLPLDAVAEELWPGGDLDTGRRRLRNVLARVRSGCGDIIVRDGSALALAEGVAIDLDAFHEEASGALASEGPAREGRARAALARYAGEVLPADPYATWADVPREEARRRALDLLDLLVDAARERGAFDEAIRLLDRSIAIEPNDESRYLACAELLLTQGRRGSAWTLVEQAARLRRAAGVPPSLRIERLLAATRRPAEPAAALELAT